MPLARDVPLRENPYDFGRYRSVVLILVGLTTLSALAAAIVSSRPAADIKGTPSYLFSIPDSGEAVTKENTLVAPLAVASHKGRLAVCDSGEGKIKFFDYAGAYKAQIDLNRLVRGEKKAYPTSLAFSDDGRLFVLDMTSSRIYVFNSDHELRATLPRRARDLKHPVTLAVVGADLYVADAEDRSIKLFSLEGEFARKIVSPERTTRSLTYVNGIGLDSEGIIYLADSNNRRVLAVGADGEEILAFDYPFGLPRGVSVDALDRVHVVDTFAHQVVVFDSMGVRLFSYGGSTEQGIKLGFPNGISTDSFAGRVFVADRADNRVQVWGWGTDSRE